jgi:chromosome segregation ATPase
MHFPAEDAVGFYSKLRNEEVDVEANSKRNTRRLKTDVETVALVPTIDAKQAQATMESDRERIFQEITDSIGMDEFNRQLQEYLEGAMRAAAMEALLQRGGLESVGAGGSKATMGVLRAELEQVKQVLAKGQEEAKQEVTDRMEVLAKETKEGVLAEVQKAKQETKQEVQETKQEVLETKQEVLETKQELAVLSAVQHETKQEVQETKQEVQETKKEVQETKQEVQETKQEVTVLAAVQEETKQQISALEGKIDSILTLLQASGRSQ